MRLERAANDWLIIQVIHMLFWVGIDGPRRMPRAVVQKLNDAMRQVLGGGTLRIKDVERVKGVIRSSGIAPATRN